MGLPIRIELEDIQAVLRVDFVIQSEPVCDLILLLNQIQLLLDHGVVLVFVLAHLEQYLDHVLRAAIDVGFVQDIPELVEHGVGDSRRHLFQE